MYAYCSFSLLRKVMVFYLVVSENKYCPPDHLSSSCKVAIDRQSINALFSLPPFLSLSLSHTHLHMRASANAHTFSLSLFFTIEINGTNEPWCVSISKYWACWYFGVIWWRYYIALRIWYTNKSITFIVIRVNMRKS